MEIGRPESIRAIDLLRVKVASAYLQELTCPTISCYAPLPTRESRKSRPGTRAERVSRASF
jgi:hypothetical protein